MATRYVQFRGDWRSVVVDHDGGFEADTNTREIEWHFSGLSADDHDALQLTDAEEQSIYDQLCESLDAIDDGDLDEFEGGLRWL